jgi:ribose/xylose/arabinose/galactoside ABC-type transport system permease subunit/ABC-type sugar transport system substrate-binding protein
MSKSSSYASERLGSVSALVALCMVFGALSPRFLSVDNFLNVARQLSLNATGMTLIIASGGVDLSVGSVVALSGVSAGLAMQAGLPASAALLLGLGVGLLCGLISGLLITRLKLSPFIATLGMMSAARGAAMVLTRGNPVSKLDSSYFFLGTGSALGIPVQVWVMGLIGSIGAFVLARTRLGRYALALGSNEEAVRLAGVPVARYKIILYVAMGGLAAISSWILSARVAFADPSGGTLMELEAIAAAVIGGASLSGGKGSVLGSLIGASIMGVLQNGLVLLGVNAFWKDVLVGVVIIAAVAADQLRGHFKARAGRPVIRPAFRYAAMALGVLVLGGVFLLGRTRQESGERPKVIAILAKSSGGEYWLAVKEAAEQTARKRGAQLVWEGPAVETDTAKQIDLLENLIQRRVDGIAISPTDARGLSAPIKKALEAGIPVVTLDSDSSEKDRLSYIGTDNLAAGEVAGKEMARILPPGAKVAVITGVLGAQNLRQRCEGFKKGARGLKLLEEQTDSGDRAKALAVVEDILTAHPDLDGIFTDTAISGPAAAQALISRGLVGKVKFISFDATPALLDYLSKGVASALVSQKPAKMGELAVEKLLHVIQGGTVEPLMDTGVDVIRPKTSEQVSATQL